MADYTEMRRSEFMWRFDEYIATLKQGDALTKEEWIDWIKGEMKEHDEQISDEQVNWIIEKLEEDGYVRGSVFYAVQETREDGWDYGSYSFEKAAEMLKEQGHGLIAVIEMGDDPLCVEEIEFDDIDDYVKAYRSDYIIDKIQWN